MSETTDAQLKCQVLSYLQTKTLLPRQDSTPDFLCYVSNTEPLQLSDGCIAVPARFASAAPSVGPGTVLRLSRFEAETPDPAQPFSLLIHDFAVLPEGSASFPPTTNSAAATSTDANSAAIFYLQDPDIAKLLQDLGKVEEAQPNSNDLALGQAEESPPTKHAKKGQTKYRLSLPTSMKAGEGKPQESDTDPCKKKGRVFRVQRRGRRSAKDVFRIENGGGEQKAQDNSNNSATKPDGDQTQAQPSADKATKSPEEQENPAESEELVVPLFQMIQQAFSHPTRRIFRIKKPRHKPKKDTVKRPDKSSDTIPATTSNTDGSLKRTPT